MKVVLLFFMLYAAVGLLASAVVHLLGFAGIAAGHQSFFIALHVGIFPLWFLVAYVASRLTRGMPAPSGWNFGSQQDYWKALMAGCPPWLRYLTQGFFIYAMASFIFFFVTMIGAPKNPGGPSSDVWRGFSGHWMLFYCAGLAILTSAYRRGLDGNLRYCRNGHQVGLSDSFCATCGTKVVERSHGS